MIILKGSERISRVYRRIKNLAELFLSGHVDNGGYGLMKGMLLEDLYKMANDLALNDAFLYPVGVSTSVLIFTAFF